MIQAGRVLAVSPHLDDAVLSAGALLAGLADRGSEVHVATLFAGPPRESLSPVARSFHDKCGLPHDATAVSQRCREDLDAVSVLGAIAHHGRLPDAVYRRRRDGTWLCDHDRAMFAEPSPDDDIAPEVRASVGSLLEAFAPDLVLTCAAVGGHIDHVLTRTAVTTAAIPMNIEILLWEDLPYAITAGLPAEVGQLTVVPASPEEWSRKRDAVARYRTQTRMLWPDQVDWEQALKEHAMIHGGGKCAEAFWEPGHDGRQEAPSSQAPRSGRQAGKLRQ